MAAASDTTDADRSLAVELFAQTLRDALSKHSDLGVTTRAPREVYAPKLRSNSTGTGDGTLARVGRHAIDALARLHADGDLASFNALLTQVFPWRDHAFGGELYRDVMPALALKIDGTDALAAFECFCFLETDVDTTTPPIDLVLTIELQASVPVMEFLERTTGFVERLMSPRSHFRVTMVDWSLGELPVENEHELRATSRLGDALLRRTPTLRGSNVSCRIPAGGGEEEGGLQFPHALGELFQVLLRVGCARLPTLEAASGVDFIEDSDLGRFKVEIAPNAHPRIAAALWSAVAFSRGFVVLEIKDETARTDDVDVVSVKYLAAAILLGKSDMKRLLWQRASVLACDINAVASIQPAISGSAPVAALWDRDWSVARHSLVFETATLNEVIAGRFGWVMHDPGHGVWIDVFVPGFAQCSVKRDRWHGMDCTAVMDPNVAYSRLEKVCLTIQSPQTAVPSYSSHLLSMIGMGLSRLTVTDDRLTPAGLLTLLESLPSLRHLRVVNFHPVDVPETTDTSRIVAKGLETLEVVIRNESPSAQAFDAFFAALFREISGNLRRARLENPAIRDTNWQEMFTPMLPFSSSFRALVQSAPRLEELALERLGLDSLDSLIAGYDHQTTRLSTLRLVNCPMPSSSLISFAQGLCRPTHRRAMPLNLLYIQHKSSLHEDEQLLQGLDVPSIRALLEAARVNLSLQSLLLLAKPHDMNQQLRDTVLNEFKTVREESAATYEAWRRAQSAKVFAEVLEARKLAWNEETVLQIFQFIAFERRDIGILIE